MSYTCYADTIRKQVVMKEYYVYMMASKRNGTLYAGFTSNLEKRAYEHKHGLMPGFTKEYGIKYLVYYESTTDVQVALKREKQLKGMSRSKKIALIEADNPKWNDLATWL